jgi:hypothetical protein
LGKNNYTMDHIRLSTFSVYSVGSLGGWEEESCSPVESQKWTVCSQFQVGRPKSNDRAMITQWMV